MPSFLNLIPSVFAFLSQTLIALEVNPVPDIDGIYRFEAQAGEIVTLEREISPGNPELCYPELISGAKVTPLERSIKLTPYRESLLVRIEESGTYQYQILSVPPIELFAGERREAVPYLPSKGHWCNVKVRLAEEYEPVWAEANRAYLEGELERALSLYRRAIALEPKYPEPYKQSIGLLLDLYLQDNPAPKAWDLNEIRRVYLSMPENIKQPMLDNIEQLARLYESSPNWQVEPTDRPNFLRDWAIFIRTGIASDDVKAEFFP